MAKKKKDRIQPTKPVVLSLSQEERELRVLGARFQAVVRQVRALDETIIPTLKEELVRLGAEIQRLQQQAEIRRLEKEAKP